MKTSSFLYFLLFASAFTAYGQTMQGTIKPGTTPRTIDIYLKPSTSFSQKDEAMTFVLAIPSNVLPAPAMGSSGVTANATGPVSGITGLQPDFLIDNLGSAQREVVVSTETINSDSYYIYTFIFAGTAAANHDWTANVEQQIFSIQFNGCTSNCDPLNELLVNLPNGGTNSNAYWYFQSNTLGDITNYAAPFYANAESGTPVNGGSSDGSALSTIALATAVTLPIKLKSFNAKANGCSINITWEIATEVNASYYVIERGENGIDFSEVSRVNATATNSLPKDYSFSDNKAPAGTLYYRLKMVDKDGQFAYSDIKSVQFANLGFAVMLYPNPVQNLAKLNITLAQAQVIKVSVSDALGNRIKQLEITGQKGMNEKTIDLSNVPNGTYMIRIQAGQNIKTLSVVKN